MLHPLIVIILGIALCAALIWLYAGARLKQEPFIEALNKRYGVGERSIRRTSLGPQLAGWKRPSRYATPWIADWSMIGVDEDYLYMTDLVSAYRTIPAVRIPLGSLTKVEARFPLASGYEFDAFEVDGVFGGQLLLPLGFVAGDRQ